jgi:hypothetical protein
MVGPSEHGNEALDSIEGEKYIFQLSDYLIFKKESIVVLWVVTSRGLVGGYQRFGATYPLQPEYGSSVILRNFGNRLQDHSTP